MNAVTRAGLVAVGLVLAGSLPASAQIPGMPLFTNPRYGTGVRIHADIGQPTDQGTQPGDLTVLQGGLTFALGPIGLGANVGMLRNDLQGLQNCNTGTGQGCDKDSKVTASALAQLRVAGGGQQNLSLSVFGGASTDLTAYDAITCTGLTGPALAACQGYRDQLSAKLLTIPVGVAVGLRIPVGLASLNLWGAPRYNISKFVNCPASNQALCDQTESNFRWAVGADFPILRILSIRAAFDSGREGGQTLSSWGVGASIGLGGMR